MGSFGHCRSNGKRGASCICRLLYAKANRFRQNNLRLQFCFILDYWQFQSLQVYGTRDITNASAIRPSNLVTWSFAALSLLLKPVDHAMHRFVSQSVQVACFLATAAAINKPMQWRFKFCGGIQYLKSYIRHKLWESAALLDIIYRVLDARFVSRYKLNVHLHPFSTRELRITADLPCFLGYLIRNGCHNQDRNCGCISYTYKWEFWSAYLNSSIEWTMVQADSHCHEVISEWEQHVVAKQNTTTQHWRYFDVDVLIALFNSHCSNQFTYFCNQKKES